MSSTPPTHRHEVRGASPATAQLLHRPQLCSACSQADAHTQDHQQPSETRTTQGPAQLRLRGTRTTHIEARSAGLGLFSTAPSCLGRATSPSTRSPTAPEGPRSKHRREIRAGACLAVSADPILRWLGRAAMLLPSRASELPRGGSPKALLLWGERSSFWPISVSMAAKSRSQGPGRPSAARLSQASRDRGAARGLGRAAVRGEWGMGDGLQLLGQCLPQWPCVVGWEGQSWTGSGWECALRVLGPGQEAPGAACTALQGSEALREGYRSGTDQPVQRWPGAQPRGERHEQLPDCTGQLTAENICTAGPLAQGSRSAARST